MKITVDRYISDHDTTLSKIYIDGEFECYGLEDEYRKTKVKGETRIPAGTYKIGVRTVGGFHSRYVKKFGDLHEGMLHVQDVPGFEYILIHTGNTDEHTMGCLLVGTTRSEKTGDMKVGASVSAYKKFYPKVIGAAKAGNLTIEYLDSDRDGAEAVTQPELSKPKAQTNSSSYVVKSGESLSVLAKKFNTSQEKLLADNADKVKTWGSVKGFNAGETITV